MCSHFWDPWAIGTNKKYRKGASTRKPQQLKYAVTVSECGTVRASPVPKIPFPSSHKSLSLREKWVKCPCVHCFSLRSLL